MTTFLRKILAAGVIAAAATVATSASALTLSLVDASANPVQNTAVNPCIISGHSCPTQPADFFAEIFDNPNGNGGSVDVMTSQPYTVGELISFLGGGGFVVGLDVNQANDAQTLDLFEMRINGSVVDLFTGSPRNVGATHNGVGYSDYLLTGFSNLELFSDDDEVVFRAAMSDMSDGFDRFFIVAQAAQVPLPATALLLLGGFGALAAVRRRKTA